MRITIHNHFRDADDPCWEGYEQRGTKEKGGRVVPNCVEVDDGGFTAGRRLGKVVAERVGCSRRLRST